LFDAVSGRAAAANDLAKAYDKAIALMRTNLNDYALFRTWAHFYRDQAKHGMPQTGSAEADKALEKAQKSSASGQSSQKQAESIDPPSPAKQAIDDEQAKATQTYLEAKLEAERLWRSAQQADEKEARRQEVLALLQLAGAAAGLQHARQSGGTAAGSQPGTTPAPGTGAASTRKTSIVKPVQPPAPLPMPPRR
jgi:hypothetical protein